MIDLIDRLILWDRPWVLLPEIASSFYRHQMRLAGHRKMLGLERIRITGGNAKFGTINSHSCSLFWCKSCSTRTVNRRMSLPKCSHASWPLPSACGEAGHGDRMG